LCFSSKGVKWLRFASTVFSRSVIMWHLANAECGMLNGEWGHEATERRSDKGKRRKGTEGRRHPARGATGFDLDCGGFGLAFQAKARFHNRILRQVLFSRGVRSFHPH
jgi:hypothetical protein